MGITASTIASLKDNQLLKRFIGQGHIPVTDTQFWDVFITFQFPHPRSGNESKIFEDAIKPQLTQLMNNNLASHNVGSLVRILMDRSRRYKKTISSNDESKKNLLIWQVHNSMFILRLILKFLAESLSEEKMIKHLTTLEINGTEEQGEAVLESLIGVYFDTVIDTPLSQNGDLTFDLHAESVNNLLVLMSVQMFTNRPSTKSHIYSCIMRREKCTDARLLTKRLLQNVIEQRERNAGQSGSIIIGLASGLWSVLSLGYGGSKATNGADAVLETESRPLARQSLLLLLVLTNHWTTMKNEYRDTMFGAVDEHLVNSSKSHDPNMSLVSLAANASVSGDSPILGVLIDFPKLHNVLCQRLRDDQATLLLYMLLHRNENFKSYVLSKTNELDHLVVPLLQVLYSSPAKNSHHVYMALIILLILSEDDLFNQSIHDITLKNVTWFTEKIFTEISLGSLLVLVLVRTIHHNIIAAKDKFLHTNLLATLANMSNFFTRLHPYACHRLVSLFARLAKKFHRLANSSSLQSPSAKTDHPVTNGGENGNGLDRQISVDADDTASVVSMATDTLHDLSLYEEVLRMVLEIINACLTSKLNSNTDLVYNLLYNRSIFEPFESNPAFQDVVSNINVALTYFASRIEALDSPTVDEVREAIRMASLQWAPDIMKKFPELKFRYVEDDQPEEFFIPYVWSLVYRSSQIYWNPLNINQFNPHRNTV